MRKQNDVYVEKTKRQLKRDETVDEKEMTTETANQNENTGETKRNGQENGADKRNINQGRN